MSIPVSCEFFPPKSDEGEAKLREVYQTLARDIRPEYFSVTFGAGGSTQTRTFETVREIQRDSGVPAAPHLSCIGSSREGIAAILDDYREQDIRRIVALRGDLPSGMQDPGDFRYANELVAFIREHSGDWFHVEVAAYPEIHPQAPNAEADLANFKRKVDAGADAAITQYFYSIEAYRRFLDDCERLNIDVPIVPGVMPITNYQQLARFSDMCGADIPRWLRKRLEGFGDDLEGLRAFGHDVVTDLCRELVDAGAPGIHFYAMNRSGPVIRLCEDAGLIGD
ncbi:methylenetetrahydrofolate reductase [NAD(P)H] [Guyparkeria hydrothermalis]|uniref:Methylenetetrahydrofolate reductase n=1 Tax=Guyparkeria halophila TaxID=47960 RepID=A0A6I6D5E6_9GAMM|nr:MULTISPECIES: methylenetetrahydrofolate reductase [NAD(P)H] [Guyparkeria]MCL7750672.1 methylenetetrahydrofolate reductase [NAD(P)H] [Guyparkeria hydrothermalis]QGT79335.1 methylenetetrahydrofolate reductase [NAD(P)H] [Guyparkeria halophila]TKA88523.1 methylenetetrahydrofolate reductase [NAD(P)H] [Guyparkeria sp. SB14A]